MTTIAYRHGIIAADTGMTVGGSRLGSARKIVCGPRGDLAGGAGSAAYSEGFCKWVAGGETGEPPKPNSDDHGMDRGVIFRVNGAIEVHEPEGAFTCQAPYYAFGSWRPEALGAMYMGATAEQAIRAAMAHGAHTFGDVETLAHALVKAVAA